MKKLLVLIVLLMPFLFLSNIQAQQWTAEQKEVWKSVETYNQLSANRDAAFINYFDDSYRGWEYESDMPETKESVKKFIDNRDPNFKNIFYTITPASIWVNGNFAYVHYFYTSVNADKDGKRNWEKGRWTDILMKKGDKWIMVGDHGGKTSK
jgi:ketosteroid isomerase-like protein